ncbi:MAG: alpha/beta hydrolase [Pseudoxanthomonas sp.]
MSADPAIDPIEHCIERVRGVYSRWRRDTPVAQMRADWDELFWSEVVTASCEPVSAGGVPAQWIVADGADESRVLLYFHGGGFQVGSLRSHRDLMARLSAAGNCRVLGVEYRLAPEHRFPSQLHDALAAYRWLLEQGIAATRLALAGDSAGAGLGLSVLLALRDEGIALPAAAVALSAWTDLTASGGSYETCADSDPIHQRRMILAVARNYLGEQGDAADPLASPLHGDLHGLPPLLLQVGDRETVLDDSRDFAAKARAAGVEVRLDVAEGMIHVYQQFADDLPQARAAIAAIGAFLQAHWPHAAAISPSQPDTDA